VLGHQFAYLLNQDRNLLLGGTPALFRSSTIWAGPKGMQLPSPLRDSESYLWIPPVLLTVVAVPALAVVTMPFFRRRMVWRLPAFREASLCRMASALAVLLKAGAGLPEALALMEQTLRGTPARADLALWKKRCSEGAGKFAAIAAGSKVFPPMFIWLVAGAGEDLAAGFERAARVYQARAAYRTNVLLYAAVPVSLLFLGLIILSQIYPIGRLVFDLPRLLLR
jgi:type II secretory pathway component PulF